MTSFSPRVRAIISDRADRYCERCGGDIGTQIHHRRPRGRGGTKRPETNQASNGLLLCARCHSKIESHRTEAYEYGWLVRQHEEPRDIPVLYRGTLVLLDDLGNVLDVNHQADLSGLGALKDWSCQQ